MNISTVKTKDGNVSYETPEGTVVHININQRSALDCLLDTFRFFRDMKKSGKKTEPSPVSGSSADLGFGVAFASLGLVSVMLAVIICIVRRHIGLWYTGVHFWVGFPFLVSGALNLLAYKYPKKCWMVFSFLSLVVNVSVSIAGMVITIGDIQRLQMIGPNVQVCYNLRDGDSGYYRATKPPRYDYENTYYLQQCKDGMQKSKDFTMCVTVMTLLMIIWGLCLTIVHIGCKIKSCCSSCVLERMEEEDNALLKPDPSDDVIIA